MAYLLGMRQDLHCAVAEPQGGSTVASPTVGHSEADVHDDRFAIDHHERTGQALVNGQPDETIL